MVIGSHYSNVVELGLSPIPVRLTGRCVPEKCCFTTEGSFLAFDQDAMSATSSGADDVTVPRWTSARWWPCASCSRAFFWCRRAWISRVKRANWTRSSVRPLCFVTCGRSAATLSTRTGTPSTRSFVDSSKIPTTPRSVKLSTNKLCTSAVYNQYYSGYAATVDSTSYFTGHFSRFSNSK